MGASIIGMRNSTSGFRILATSLDIDANKVSSFHFRREPDRLCAVEIQGGSARSVLDSFLPAKNRLWLRDTIRGKEENRDGDADKSRRGQKGREMEPIPYAPRPAEIHRFIATEIVS